MEKREVILYIITIISLIAFIYVVFGAVSRVSNISDKKSLSMTENAVLDLENNFKVGDSLTGDIIINSNESDKYGILLLTKDNKPIITKTFNLKNILENTNSNPPSIKIENLIDYKFEEKGKYELMFSILDLNINIKKEFVVG